MEVNELANRKKYISVLVGVLIIGIIVFAGIALGIHYAANNFIDDKTFGDNAAVLTLVAGAVIIIISKGVYSKRMNNFDIASSQSEDEFKKYVAITITHLAVCEGLAICSIILFLLFGNFLFFLPVGMSIVEMFRIFLKIKAISI
jgi:hypothetical protein